MKWISRIIVSIVGLLGLVLWIGGALPKEHSSTVEVDVKATAASVYETLRDVSQYKTWRHDLKSVEITDNETWSETNSYNDTVTFRFVEQKPPTLLRVRIVNENLPFGGEWTYTISQKDKGAHVAIREDGFIKNWLFRFMARFLLGYDYTMKRMLSDLRAALDKN